MRRTTSSTCTRADSCWVISGDYDYHKSVGAGHTRPLHLGRGKYVMVTRVLGQDSPGSTGQFVDLDGFWAE